MKKADFVALVAERAGVTQKEAVHLMDTTFACLGDVMADGERISVSGFGVFETRERAARAGRVPSTGEHILIPPATVPVFKPAKQLKEKVTKR